MAKVVECCDNEDLCNENLNLTYFETIYAGGMYVAC